MRNKKFDNFKNKCKMKMIFILHLGRVLHGGIMTNRKYKTKGKDRILLYLKDNPNTHITAEEIYNYLKAGGEKIGLTTIYRQLENLVKEGMAIKYVNGRNIPACFQYVKEGEERRLNIYHMKCENCGKLTHLSCDQVDKIINHISEEHGFVIDAKRTVFYGLCPNCRD